MARRDSRIFPPPQRSISAEQQVDDRTAVAQNAAGPSDMMHVSPSESDANAPATEVSGCLPTMHSHAQEAQQAKPSEAPQRQQSQHTAPAASGGFNIGLGASKLGPGASNLDKLAALLRGQGRKIPGLPSTSASQQPSADAQKTTSHSACTPAAFLHAQSQPLGSSAAGAHSPEPQGDADTMHQPGGCMREPVQVHREGTAPVSELATPPSASAQGHAGPGLTAQHSEARPAAAAIHAVPSSLYPDADALGESDSTAHFGLGYPGNPSAALLDVSMLSASDAQGPQTPEQDSPEVPASRSLVRDAAEMDQSMPEASAAQSDASFLLDKKWSINLPRAESPLGYAGLGLASGAENTAGQRSDEVAVLVGENAAARPGDVSEPIADLAAQQAANSATQPIGDDHPGLGSSYSTGLLPVFEDTGASLAEPGEPDCAATFTACYSWLLQFASSDACFDASAHSWRHCESCHMHL